MFTKLNCLIRLNKKTLGAFLIVLFVLGFPVLTEDLTNSNSNGKCIEDCNKAFNETDGKLQRTKTDSYRDADEAKAVAKSDCKTEFTKESSKCTADYVGETNKCFNQWSLAGSLNQASYNQAVASAWFSFSYGVTQGPQMAVATNSAANKFNAAFLEAAAQYQKCIGDRGAELTRCDAYAKSNYDSCVEKAESNARRAKYAAEIAYRNSRYAAEEVKEKCIQKCNSSS